MQKAHPQNTHSQVANQQERLDPAAFSSLIRQFTNAKALAKGRWLHSRIVGSGYAGHTFLGNLLVHMYANCGSLEDAITTFGQIEYPNVFSWTIMLAAYTQNGHVEDAGILFQKMPRHNVVSSTAMLTAYAQNGHMDEAMVLFKKMPQRNAVTWTTIAAAHAQNKNPQDAIAMFHRMPQRDCFAWNVMVAGYSQYGHFEDAKAMFDRMPERSDVSWNTMLAGLSQNGSLQDTQEMFRKMPQWTAISWNTMITAYAQNGEMQQARDTFEKTPQCDVVSWNAIVAGYGQSKNVEEARRMFDKIPQKNGVSWIAMISAYAENGHGREALQIFRLMDMEGFEPGTLTCTNMLDACASAGGLAEGKIIHASILDAGRQLDVLAASSLINMYGKCGCLGDAAEVFSSMPRADTVAWSALIAAYAQNGRGGDALELFQRMSVQGMQPDHVTFVSIISACSHRGLVEDGRLYFLSMVGDYGITATLEHYKCMIDLLGRAGRLESAEELIEEMPYVPDSNAWMALLSACRSHGGCAKEAARVARQVGELDEANGAPYVLLAGMHTSSAQPSSVKTVSCTNLQCSPSVMKQLP